MGQKRNFFKFFCESCKRLLYFVYLSEFVAVHVHLSPCVRHCTHTHTVHALRYVQEHMCDIQSFGICDLSC